MPTINFQASVLHFITSQLIFIIFIIFGAIWILYLIFLLILWIYQKIRNFFIRRSNIKMYNELLNIQTYDGNTDDICTICISKYSVDDIVCTLPCDHKYHDKCIRVWFKIKTICPLCKTKIGLERIVIV